MHDSAPPVPAQRSVHSEPPPGYAIETNGILWRWTKQGAAGRWEANFARYSWQAAIESAWDDCDNGPMMPWIIVTPARDPNAGLMQQVEPMPMIDNNAKPTWDHSIIHAEPK